MGSVGNLIDSGNKGKNMPFQMKNLMVLGRIAASIAPPGGLATEATQLNVLSALQTQQEFFQNLVIDTGGAGCPGNCPVYSRVMTYDEGTGAWTISYYDAAGNVVVPVGPVAFLNPQYVLEDIYTALTSVIAANHVQTDIVSMPAITGSVSVSNMIPAVETGLAKDATFTAVNRTPSFIRVSAIGTVLAGARSVSFYNSGSANATVSGPLGVLKPGEEISFSAGAQKDLLTAISYDSATNVGAELLIVEVR